VDDCYTNVDGMPNTSEKRTARPILWLLVWLAFSAGVQGQNATPQIAAGDLVRDVVAHEIAAANGTTKHMFRSHKLTPKGSQTRIYVETNDAMAGMLIAVNGHPLSAQQHQAEMDHLNWLMDNPDQLRKKRSREKEDADRTLKIVKALPEAFRYEYDGTEPGTGETGKAGDELVRLKFTPNPSYSPPSRVEQVLAGMQGYLLIDSTERRIARIDGTLFRDVTFGWGILAHLDKGGHFRVQQADVGNGSWEITHMNLKMTGKILMFKSLSLISDETLSDFRVVPENLPFRKGVDLLKSELDTNLHASAPDAPGTNLR
jgi:hypothetical protein